MEEIKIDFQSKFYKNCKSQRKRGAQICGDCPFRKYIEEEEYKDGVKSDEVD